jgi:hypothetical protein
MSLYCRGSVQEISGFYGTNISISFKLAPWCVPCVTRKAPPCRRARIVAAVRRTLASAFPDAGLPR